jgi:predicted phage baseplate assembly protein
LTHDVGNQYTAAESLEEVRLYAPQAFRTQERAVTAEDYVVVAQRHPEVQKAMATRRWTGSWYTMFLTIDRRHGLAVDAAFEEVLRRFLERFRLAGQDLEIDGPRFVSLDIAFVVCVEPDYYRSEVKADLLDVFSSRDLPDGRRGFFHPDNFSFGQPVYLSQIVAAAMRVPGVRWIDVADRSPNRFKRQGEPAHAELAAGQISIGRLEIARLDNDPSRPENGKLDFVMQGGI